VRAGGRRWCGRRSAVRAAARQRRELGIHERLVRPGGAAHGLRRVVDEDVERSVGGDGIREADDLGGVAQVDADDLEPVDPVAAVGQRREAADGVAREAGRDRRVAPSRSSRSAMYMPIFARPPVSRARRPVRSVRASRLAWLIAAQSGQSWW
jgi:hypothetical protein